MNTEKIDDTTLALMLLGLHDENRVWKGYDWDAMNRLHEKGYLSDPISKTKSVVLTDAGLNRAKELFVQMFEK